MSNDPARELRLWEGTTVSVHFGTKKYRGKLVAKGSKTWQVAALHFTNAMLREVRRVEQRTEVYLYQ